MGKENLFEEGIAMKNIFLFLVARIAYKFWERMRGRPPFGPHIFGIYLVCVSSLPRRKPYWQDLDELTKEWDEKKKW